MNEAVILPPSDLRTRRARPDLADPRRDIRTGSVIASLFFVVFLGWAALARLDAGAYATGALAVSGQRQSVQHRDGGVIQAIHVREGQRVVSGQLLIQLAAAEVEAQERALASQTIRLLAQRARLDAEQLRLGKIAAPRAYASLSLEDRAEAASAMRAQQEELTARRAVLAAQRGTLGERALQSSAQGRGYRTQAGSTSEQLRLINAQINALRPVAEKGFVSETRMRELERARAELMGRQGQYDAGEAQSKGAIRENAKQVLEAEQSFRERTASDLREVEASLGEVMPKWAAARDLLARTRIRAPATGAVVGLSVFTPGGVISPGQKLMDVVPESAPLSVQARIAPDDADDLAIGQRTLIRFSGLHDRSLPNLEGRLTRLSADSFTDERSGQAFFTGEITVGPDQLRIIKGVRGRDFDLRPGMPVQVIIPLRKRTALDYALEPLIGSFWSSFREH